MRRDSYIYTHHSAEKEADSPHVKKNEEGHRDLKSATNWCKLHQIDYREPIAVNKSSECVCSFCSPFPIENWVHLNVVLGYYTANRIQYIAQME